MDVRVDAQIAFRFVRGASRRDSRGAYQSLTAARPAERAGKVPSTRVERVVACWRSGANFLCGPLCIERVFCNICASHYLRSLSNLNHPLLDVPFVQSALEFPFVFVANSFVAAIRSLRCYCCLVRRCVSSFTCCVTSFLTVGITRATAA